MRDRLLRLFLYFPRRDHLWTPGEAGLAHEEVTFPTEDGERLHGWWLPATVKPALGHVLFFHGNAGNIGNRLESARRLGEAGFDCLLFDYRGYGRSSGRPSEAGTYEDGRAARKALLSRPEVAADRVLYLGESLGGAIALATGIAAPPRALVLQSTFTSVRAMAALHHPFIPAALVPDAYPSLRRMAALEVPLLVLHGDRDSLIPAEHGRALLAACPGPKRFHLVPDAGHGDLVYVAGSAYGAVIAGWFREVVA